MKETKQEIECPDCGWIGDVNDLICLEGIALGDGGFGCPECHRQLQTWEKATKDIL